MHSFDNDNATNVIIFGAYNSSSTHFDNRKNTFLILGEGPTFVINGSSVPAEKNFNIKVTKGNAKFCLSWHYNPDISYLFVN